VQAIGTSTVSSTHFHFASLRLFFNRLLVLLLLQKRLGPFWGLWPPRSPFSNLVFPCCLNPFPYMSEIYGISRRSNLLPTSRPSQWASFLRNSLSLLLCGIEGSSIPTTCPVHCNLFWHKNGEHASHPTICKSPHCIQFLVLRLAQLCFQFTFRRRPVLPLPYLLEDDSWHGRTSQNKIALSLSRV